MTKIYNLNVAKTSYFKNSTRQNFKKNLVNHIRLENNVRFKQVYIRK